MKLLLPKQMDVFSALVKLKSATAGHLAQATGMHRQSVRIILANLEKQGFVRKHLLKNSIFYEPEKLHELKRCFQERLLSHKQIIPRLAADYQDSKDTQVINAVKGRKGFETVLIDEIIKGKEIKAFNLAPMDEYKDELKANDGRRIKHNIPIRILTNNPLSVPFSRIKRTRLKSKVNVNVYSNKVSILCNDDSLTIFTIKIREITQLFSDIFDNCWKK
jgi:sugar-specific transcriptional regulator TrmB